MSTSQYDTIFDEEEIISEDIADIHFDLPESEGKWLLKVVSGPNGGAEFFLAPSGNYLIGTDDVCDIIFNDLSVSRQHARLIVDDKETVFIEDLGSKNGSFIEGEKIAGRKNILSNTLVTMGTTTFMLIDRTGEHHTIVSPQFVPTKKEEPTKEPTPISPPIQTAVLAPMQSEIDKIKEEEKKEARTSSAISALIVLALVTGVFIVAGIGTKMLFRTEVVPQERTEDINTSIRNALQEFPSIRYSYNPTDGKLLLVGHLSTVIDEKQLNDKIKQLKFILSVDNSNVIIDNLVVSEFNTLLSKFPSWQSIAMTVSSPGKFQLTGSLKTKKELEELNRYVAQNFPYIDLLDTRVTAEEDVKNKAAQKLLEQNFRNIALGINDGEIVLTGTVGNGKMALFNKTLDDIKTIPGIRQVTSYVVESSSEQAYINISNRYTVSGYSAHGKSISVVIDGRILSKGDTLDGMTITDIQNNTILLEKEGFKYKIDFNR